MGNLKSTNTPYGTTIWNLCRKGINHIHHHIYKIPGNGMKILLWEDNSLGNPPLSTLNPLSEIKSWLINKGLLRLVDIYLWDDNGTWVGWVFPELPQPLHQQQKLLITSLAGLAPIHRLSKDNWG